MNTNAGWMGKSTVLVFLVAFVGCAGRAPKGAEIVHPAWHGAIDTSIRLGVYLAAEPGAYSQAGFEVMSRAEETMAKLRPGIRWAWIDSSHPGTGKLNGWDLDSLGQAIRADTALSDRKFSGMSKLVAPLSPSTRSALERVRMAYAQDYLVVIRSGGHRAEKDSTKLFQDQAWFGIFDLKESSLLYSLQAPSEGKQSATASAESDWARSIWDEFRQALESLPKRLR